MSGIDYARILQMMPECRHGRGSGNSVSCGTILEYNPADPRPKVRNLVRNQVRNTATVVSPRPIIAIILLATSLSFALPVDAQVIRPREVNTQFHRARTAWQSGSSILEAKARIDRVLTAVPNDPEARILRAEILLGMNRPDSALVDARRAAELMPTSGLAHLVHCEAASRSGLPEEAARAMRRSADQIMRDAGWYVRLSRCAESLERLPEAESYARLAIAQGTLNPAGHIQLARVFVVSGDTDMAVTTLVKGIENGVIRPSIIRQDSVLVDLVDDPRIRAAMR